MCTKKTKSVELSMDEKVLFMLCYFKKYNKGQYLQAFLSGNVRATGNEGTKDELAITDESFLELVELYDEFEKNRLTKLNGK